MSKQRDREEFVAIMTAEGVPLDAARGFMRAATTLHRIAELECSSEAADRDRVRCPGDYRNGGGCLCRDYGSYDREAQKHGRVPRVTVKGMLTEQRVARLAIRYGLTAVFSGDPRGAVFKLKVPSGRTNDWGQTGICVP